MGAQRVLVVANRERTARILVGQFKAFFGDRVAVEGRSLEHGLGERPEGALVVTSTPLMTSRLGDWLLPGTAVVTAVRTLRRQAWEEVMALPARTAALVVNDGPDTAVDTVALLRELGAVHLALTPVYPGMSEVPRVQLAITPGEPHLVPPWVERVLDLGDRVLDPATILEVLTLLGRFGPEEHRRLAVYEQQVMTRPGTRQVLQWFSALRQDLEAVLDAVHEGILAVDGAGIVRLVNRTAEQILGQQAWQVVGQSIGRIRAALGVGPQAWPVPGGGPEVLRVGGREVVATAASRGADRGVVYTLRYAQDLEEADRRLRLELRERGFVARYTFTDIVGESQAIRDTVARAMRLVGGAASILLIGESGTGKELFAQAIHNASPRAPYPFVAINCAAIPESLLESELFGYEEGAFTGARRGGKAGLFEQAHRGTIFLDEIADLSPALQARLLRVLQEREVMRVGATRVRPVDVRVIGATNQDLEAAVAAGRFRADLYYRLAVLPLHIPPLRERKEDIPLLVRRFLDELGDPRPLPPDVLGALLAHDWPGNVRELRSCVEYLATVCDGEFRVTDLPPSVRRAQAGRPNGTGAGVRRADLARFLLDSLQSGEGTGRRSLVRAARAAGFRVGEAEVRRCLRALAEAGLVEPRRGRSGTRLTPAGTEYVQESRHSPI
ncbi:sigma-54 interaction domain-containing protein [Caldinitratiruptor microaerophilus]|uniref:ATPase AAA n=1 Tax=Caldinitratiruptor microaerophilus TaxID=671077 RepID=A0AA35CJ61_9FIRM|nr:sigma 54-interacting transcriptional regulator [Caldinitratiruptor microaerophilus]BDG60167.1 ATPase AAA [Caldinitratiruptor microaerophilus]